MLNLKNGAWVFVLAGLSLSSGPVLNAATILVKMRESGADFFFDPTNITINPGDTVEWTNTSPHMHNTTHNPAAGQRLWSSPSFSSSSSPNTFSFVFSSPGVYPYNCSLHSLTHPEESGTVFVPDLNQPPTVAITAPTNGTVFFAPASFTVEATASDSDGSVRQVEFFLGKNALGIGATCPWRTNVTALGAGDYSFTAVATDYQGAKTTSSVVNVTVITPPVIHISNVQRFGDGSFQFRVGIGNPGETCIIDACDTLPNWTPILTNIFPNTDCAACPFLDFTDSTTNLNRRFYRSRVLP